MTEKLSIIPPTGEFPTTGIANDQWINKPNLPQGKDGLISAAGWTYGNEGFIQQTFLGASIRSFNIVAGFGDSNSTLSVQLVNDEYNSSDKTGLGIGDDVYHSGVSDRFSPPPVGSPVFFKFGKNHATVEQAWRRLFDVTYGTETIPASEFEEKEVITSISKSEAIKKGYLYDIERKGWVDLSSDRAKDDEYAGDEVSKFIGRGKDHLIFGGILQSYNQNKGMDGNPVYSVTVVDPREILSNVQLILNNYTGSVFGNKNFVNIYGFLEYDISDQLQDAIDAARIEGYATTIEESAILKDPTKWTKDLPLNRLLDPNLLKSVGNAREKLTNNIEKIVFTDGEMKYFGTDMHYLSQSSKENSEEEQIELPVFLPMTGEGFARRSNQGIPWYRVRQAIDAIFEFRYRLPNEYKEQGFGSQIDFRGFNYVVDLSGLPLEKIPQMYFLDFDQIDLLSLIQEICDVISHDLYITLLPVINHPACLSLYQINQEYINNKQWSKIVAGIIRIEAIDRSAAPEIGAIKKYIEELKEQKNIEVENQNLGYELANITTDKIVVGAQKVDIHFFSDNKDRDNLLKRLEKAGDQKGKDEFEKMQSEQWTLENSLQQQILPFYGFINKNVPTIPRGFGPFQQILLDTTGLDADGVGRQYIATEMELRAAAISYEQWARFLLQYNETYIEEIGENSLFYKELESNEKDPNQKNEPNGLPEKDEEQKDTDLINKDTPWLANRTFGVSVPRCVFLSEKNYIAEDGYPASPCSPPFGYPLYYKRAEKIGIPEAGIVKYQNAVFEVISNYEKLSKEAKKRDELMVIQQDAIDKFAQYQIIYNSKFRNSQLSEEDTAQWQTEQATCNKAMEDVKNAKKLKENVAAMREFIVKSKGFIKKVNQLSKKHLKNAKKVYEFVKDVADRHLGKTFLVKIPRSTNLFYSDEIQDWNIDPDNLSNGPVSINNYKLGPFGFEPDFSTLDVNTYFSKEKKEEHLNEILESKRSKFEYSDKCFNFNSVLAWNSNGVDYGGSTQDMPEELDKSKIYLPESRQYYYGGLKVNFNPISDNWEFNYKPSSQGGFFKPELFPQVLSYSTLQLAGYNDIICKGQKQFLIPMDLNNFEENGRIFAYVRYDHSEDLDLSSVGRENLYQQKMDGEHHIPDSMEDLNNVVIDNTETFNAIGERTNKENEGKPRDAYVAFVKCEVDENLYLLPQIESVSVKVYGRETLYVENARSLKTIEITDEFGCKKLVPAKPYSLPIFTLDTDGGSGKEADERDLTATFFEFKRTNAEAFKMNDYNVFKNEPTNDKPNLIDTEKTNLSSDHIYAIITIPGRIVPTIDKRYVDGPYQALNGADIKHLLTQDTVSPAPLRFRFDKPSQIQGKSVPIDCDKFTFTQLTNAQRLQKLTLQSLGFADPQISIGFSQPSPVYPNLVAIPLLSTEKCYGPWFSSSILNGYSNNGERYKNIGGKVEFVKDENLAPWNYTGYKLMNEAGSIQAQFSNSLLLFSENGGLSYPDAPNGVDLARPLGFGGPLITSISVDINESSIKTNIRMDLYTSRFGKLSKQREAVIAQVMRERQKLIDQKNYLIRRGFNKNQANNDILSDIRKQGQSFKDNSRSTSDLLEDYQKNKPLPDQLVVSLSSSTETLSPISTTNIVGAGNTPTSFTQTTYTQKASMQDVSTLNERYQILANEGDENTVNKLYNQTAGSNLSQWLTGYSTLPIGSENSANFASVSYSSKYIEQK